MYCYLLLPQKFDKWYQWYLISVDFNDVLPTYNSSNYHKWTWAISIITNTC